MAQTHYHHHRWFILHKGSMKKPDKSNIVHTHTLKFDTRSSALAETCELGDFKSLKIGPFRVTLRLNLRLRCYVLCQYLWTVRWGRMVILQFAAGSFHTTKVCSRLYSIETELY